MVKNYPRSYYKKSFVFFTLLLLTFSLHAQDDAKSIVPLSPNAASIAKYGNVPVSLYTGVPQISQPLFEVQSGVLSMPLSLSYHAGGNKVESVASWVGLGWSISGIPQISRSIRGLPDEHGFFTNHGGKTVDQWMSEVGSTAYNIFVLDVVNGVADSEPDVFSYSLINESGKFSWSQELQEFVTFPYSKTKISWDGINFKIVSSDGTTYYFGERETQQVSGSSGATPNTTTWKASLISSNTHPDTIRLEYDAELQVFDTKNSFTRYQWLSGHNLEQINSGDNNSILNVNEISAKMPSKIFFRTGVIEFKKNISSQREDLIGGYSLERILVNNIHGQTVKEFEFGYSYLVGAGVQNESDQNRKWMILDTWKNKALNGGDDLVHSFEYKQTQIPPSRTSSAQDFWGFYNGKTTNVDLIPPTVLINGLNPPIQIPGADRSVSVSGHANFGILEKIMWPTGGSTQFEYENNDLSGDAADVNLNYEPAEPVYVGGDSEPDGTPSDPEVTGDGTPASPYKKPFEINNPPDENLNGGNLNGGAFVSFDVTPPPGCDLSGGSAACAVYRVNGITNPTEIYYLSVNTSFYLPNGEYELSASFDPAISDYGTFWLQATWDKVDSSLVNKLGSGIRCKKITNRDASNDIVSSKEYIYKDSIDSPISSGGVFSRSANVFTDEVTYRRQQSSLQILTGVYLRRRAYNNAPHVSSNGSIQGYKTVFVREIAESSNGFERFDFTHWMDEGANFIFPYAPSTSLENQRGHISRKEVHHSDSTLLYEEVNQYSELPRAGWNANKSVKGIKVASLFFDYQTGINGHIPTHSELYELKNDAFVQANAEKKQFFDQDIQLSFRTMEYHGDHNWPTSIKTHLSDGSVSEEKLTYPIDYTAIVSGSPIDSLVAKNAISQPVEKSFWKDGTLVDAKATVFHDFSDVLSAKENLDFNRSNTYIPSTDGQSFVGFEKTAEVKVRDSYGNPLEIESINGITTSYIWGYNSSYPIAKVENVSYSALTTFISNLQALSNADDDTCWGTIPTDCNESELRNALNSLRNEPTLSAAFITTYTYDPLVGVTSITDVNEHTTFYEYDEFNRLRQIVDQDRNIIQAYEYNYYEAALGN
ncbi:MAG: hypothetical protein ABJG47_12890 [Ekhidna sp.]